MSWLDNGRGGALVPPPQQGNGARARRNRPSILNMKSLRMKYKALEDDEKESLIADILGGLADEDVLKEAGNE